jgi:hypothetical protein
MSIAKWALCALALGCALSTRSLAAQEPPKQRLAVVTVDTSHLPELSLRFGLFDEQGQPIRNLVAGDVRVAVDGQQLTATPTLTSELSVPAVAIVADFSAAMADRSAPGVSRLEMQRAQIERLLALLPPDAPISLLTVGSQAKLELGWGASASDLRATLDALAGNGLPAQAQNTPYPLNEAIAMGLKTIAEAPPSVASHPAILLVYGAGSGGQSLDAAALRRQLGEMRLNQPTITFVGLGGAAAGEFASLPGNPASLEQTAAALPNAAFLPAFAANANQMQLRRNDLDRRYRTLVNIGQLYTLSIDTGALQPGAHAVDISARRATASVVLQFPAVAPMIAVDVTNSLLRDGSHIAVKVRYKQRPIKQVEYFLDGRSIGVSSEEPDFTYAIDLAKLTAAGGPLAGASQSGAAHELAAIATDVDGRQSARSSGVQVWFQLPERPTTQPDTAAATRGWLPVALAGIGVVALLAAGWITATRRKQAQPVAPPASPPAHASLSGSTVSVVRSVQPLPGARTALVSASTLRLTILTGLDRHEYTLRSDREWKVGRRPGHAVWIDDNQVSSDHARLAPAEGGVQLTDLKSTNGTFVGEHKQQLTPNRPTFVRFGEVFWIGPDIKLLVEQRKP